MTCEQCGADAMVGGVCQHCGWRVPADRAGGDAGSALLAETREADIPMPARRPVTARNFGPPTPYPDAGSGAPVGGAPITPRTAPRSGNSGPTSAGGPYGAPGPSTGRFCGTCGARIEPGQMFCGQCGAAVAAFESSSVNHPTVTNRGRFSSSGFANADDDVWSPADQDAPTEQFVPVQGGYGYHGGGAYTPAPPARGMSREMRAVLGILCILGGLISGAGAILLAFVK